MTTGPRSTTCHAGGVLPLRDFNPRRRLPLFTLLLIAANVLVFVFVQPGAFHQPVPTSQETNDEATFLYENAVVPCELTHLKPLSPSLEAGCRTWRSTWSAVSSPRSGRWCCHPTR